MPPIEVSTLISGYFFFFVYFFFQAFKFSQQQSLPSSVTTKRTLIDYGTQSEHWNTLACRSASQICNILVLKPLGSGWIAKIHLTIILYSDSITILDKCCHPTAKGMSHNRKTHSWEEKHLSLSNHFSDSLLQYSADLQPPTVSTAHNSGSDSLAQVQTGHLSPSHLHFQPMSLRMNIYLAHISPLIGMFPEICLWKRES